MKKCRTCEINNSFVGETGSHYLEIQDYTCPLCNNDIFIVHKDDNIGLFGSSYECSECNDYIKYYFEYDINGTPIADKDEIYIDNYMLIRDLYGDNIKSRFYILTADPYCSNNDKEESNYDLIYEMPGFYEYSTTDILKNKFDCIKVFN